MSTVVNSFPITVTPPSGFTETAALEGKFLTVAGDQKIAWSSVITLLEQIFDGSETVITGSNVTGNGTQADPYVISNEAGGVGSGNASVVVADNLGQLPAVGSVSTVYFVFDKDGEGTNGVFAYRPSVTGYEDMTPGGSGGGGAVDSVNGETGVVVLDADDIDDSATTNKFATATQLANADSAVQPGDLATVATSGAYADLTGAPDLSAFDNVDEHPTQGDFPPTGVADRFYVAQDTGDVFRWNGSSYSLVTGGLALGETAQTAYRGDRGKVAYDHSQVSGSNPHNVNKVDVGLGSVDNTSDADKPISTATQTALDGKAEVLHDHLVAQITDFDAQLVIRNQPDVRTGTTVLLDNNIAGAYYNEGTPSNASTVSLDFTGEETNGAALFFSDGTEITTISSSKTLLLSGSQPLGEVAVLSFLNTPNYVLACWIPTADQAPLIQLSAPTFALSPGDTFLSYAISNQDSNATNGVMEISTDGINWTAVDPADYDGDASTTSGTITGLTNGTEYQVRFKNTATGFSDSAFVTQAETPDAVGYTILLQESFAGTTVNPASGTILNPDPTIYEVSQNNGLLIDQITAGTTATYANGWESVQTFNPASQPELVVSFQIRSTTQETAPSWTAGFFIDGPNRFALTNSTASTANIRSNLRDSGTILGNEEHVLNIITPKRVKIAMTPDTCLVSYWDTGTAAWVTLRAEDISPTSWVSQAFKISFNSHANGGLGDGNITINDLYVTDGDFVTETP